MKELVEQVRNAPPELFDDLLHALCYRYREISPGWDIFVHVVEKKEDFNAHADDVIALMQRLKDK